MIGVVRHYGKSKYKSNGGFIGLVSALLLGLVIALRRGQRWLFRIGECAAVRILAVELLLLL